MARPTTKERVLRMLASSPRRRLPVSVLRDAFGPSVDPAILDLLLDGSVSLISVNGGTAMLNA